MGNGHRCFGVAAVVLYAAACGDSGTGSTSTGGGDAATSTTSASASGSSTTSTGGASSSSGPGGESGGAGGTEEGGEGGEGGAGGAVAQGGGGPAGGGGAGGAGGSGGTGAGGGSGGAGGGLPGTPCAERAYQYETGHGDLYVGYDGEALSLGIRSQFDANVDEEVLVDPEDVCIRVGVASPFLLPVELEEEFGETGILPETPFWLIPENGQDVPEVPWLGLASYELTQDVFGLYSSLHFLPEQSVMPAGASLTWWVYADAATFWLRSYGDSPDLVFDQHINESHAHMSWGFTHPGEYRLTFQAEANRLVDDVTLASEPVTYAFLIGEEP